MATVQVVSGSAHKRYQKGFFVILRWEGDADERGEIDGIASHFEEKLGYSVVNCSLGPEVYDPLSGVLRELNGDLNLLVVYYRGSGRKFQGLLYLKPYNTFVYAPFYTPSLDLTPRRTEFDELQPRREICWSGIEDKLLRSTADVLMILDCPFGNLAHFRHAFSFDDSVPVHDEHCRLVELLTSRDTDLPDSRRIAKASFTECLIWALEQLWIETRDGFVSTSELWRRIREAPSYSGAQFQPVYGSLFRRSKSIKLAQPQLFFDFSLPFRNGYHYKLLAADESNLFKDPELIYEDGWTEVYKGLWRFGMSGSDSNGRPAGMHVAMKRFRPKNIIQELDIQLVFERERNNLAIISTWKHCRILEFLGSFEVSDTKYGHFNLIFPYAEGGDLHSFLRLDREPQWLTDYHSGKYTVYEAICKEITGLAEAVAFIHGIKNTMYAVHRDIKPNNIFIHESKFKLGDFGLSRLKDCEESSKSEWLAGTRMYNPPERDFQEKHGRARDVWALGCVILELIVLLEHGWKKPAAVDAFQQARMRSTPQRVRAFSQTMKCVREWIARLEDNGAQIRPIGAMLRVVRKMLDPDPQTRCTAHEAARDFGDEMFHIEMFHTENYGQGRSAPGVLPSGE